MYDMAISNRGPTPCFSSLVSALTYPTATGVAQEDPVETWSVFALSLPLKTQTGLSTGAKTGIGVGAALSGIFLLSAVLFLFRLRYTRSRRSAPRVSTASLTHRTELGSQQVSEVPGNSLNIAGSYSPQANMQEQQSLELQGDRRTGRQELTDREHKPYIHQLP
jgi:hypothetical protein